MVRVPSAPCAAASRRPDDPTQDVGYINAHGTSTPQGDVAETQAVKAVFGDQARKLVFGSTKSMTGHLLGAAGGVEFTICTLVLKHGVIPPTINTVTPDPECDLDCAPNHRRAPGGRGAVQLLRLRRPQRDLAPAFIANASPPGNEDGGTSVGSCRSGSQLGPVKIG